MMRLSLATACLSTFLAIADSQPSFGNPAIPAVTFTENFNTTANWSTTSPVLTAPALSVSGGPDGSSYVSRTATAAGAPDLNPPVPVVLFRAQDGFNSSGNQFVNNWLSGNITQVTAYVRHNASVPLPFFLRFTPPAGTPGIIFETGSLTPASVNSDWTKLTFDINPSNPFFTPEGPPSLYGTVLSDVGRMQIGFTVPVGFGLDPNTYIYDLDIVSSVPEPASWMLLMGAAMIGWVRRKRRATH
jgi:hypothetical protein